MSRAAVVPAVIPASLRDLEAAAARVRRCVPRIQVDIIDGVYAPEASWPFAAGGEREFRELVSEKRGLPFWEELDYDLDAMVQRPERYLGQWISAGFSTVIIHLSSTREIPGIIHEAKERDVAVALALRPSDACALAAPYIEDIAFIQCMGSDTIGFHGVPLDPHVYEKIREIKQRWPSLPVAVDIGVSEATAPRLRETGADILVSGSAVFSSPDPCAAIARLSGEGEKEKERRV